MVKKVLKVLLIVLYLIGVSIGIYMICKCYSNEATLTIILSVLLFIVYLLVWIAPKKFFDFCWRFEKIYPDNPDYDMSYSNINKVGVGTLVAAFIFLAISILVTI